MLLWPLLAIAIGLYGCQDTNSTKGKIIEQPKALLNQLGFSAKPSVVQLNNQLFLLNAEKRGVVFYEVGKETIISEDSAGQHWLHTDGKNIYALWWSAKDKAKALKVRVSADGGKSFSEAVTINNDTGVLPDISIASNGLGQIAVAYTDERKPGYGVYLNTSADSGVTWRKEDLRLDNPVVTSTMKQSDNTEPATYANSPKLAFFKDQLMAIWQQVDMTEMGGTMLRIVAKTSKDLGQSWSAEANVFAAPNMQPVEMNAFNNDKAMYVFAMITEGGKGFTGFYSSSIEANTWAELSNATLGTDFNKRQISWIRGATSGENLALAFTSEPVEGKGKVQADVAILSTTTNQWLGPLKQLDIDKGNDLTKSTYPDIVDAGQAGLIVVWEDYRTLVPSIYMDLSKDNGKTWLSKPKPLTTPGLTLSKDPKLVLGSDKLWLLYFMVNLDGKNSSGTRVYQDFSKGDDGQFIFPNIDVPMPPPDELKARLIEKANKFWALREERKWEETWPYMEPVYRERFDKAQWLAQQGKLSFSKTVVDENSVVITGNIGILDANVDVSVNQQVSKEGLLESAPPKQQKVEMRWGWFYDDWYFMPDIIFGNHLEF
jgi:hypothetical protein